MLHICTEACPSFAVRQGLLPHADPFQLWLLFSFFLSLRHFFGGGDVAGVKLCAPPRSRSFAPASRGVLIGHDVKLVRIRATLLAKGMVFGIC